MSSLDSLPAATPYPWGLNDYQIFESKGRKRKGTGIAFLQFTLQNGKVSKGAAKILTELLPDLADKTANDFCPNMSTALLGKYIPTPIHSAQPEDEILRLASEGNVSLFASLLKIIDNASPAAVLNKTMMRSCVLSIRPGSVPANMDAKDMVMAALFFLSRDNPSNSKEFLDLPLIRPVVSTEDLEKRSYEKVGTWNISTDFLIKVGALEIAFMESAASWQDLPRDRMLPCIPYDDERILLYKGNVPSSATPKAKKGGAQKRRILSSPVLTEMSDLPSTTPKVDDQW